MYIKIRAKPKSKKEFFKKITEDTFEIGVREEAKMNMANKRILEILSEQFKIPIKSIRIINGHQSPSKLISISPKTF